MPSALCEQTDRIVAITINRPDAMNAIDPDTHQALIEAWTRFRDDDSAWVAILTGPGEKAFGAGADLKKMLSMLSRSAKPRSPASRAPAFCPEVRCREMCHRTEIRGKDTGPCAT
jgi:enoyl-CoA hydratase